MQQQALKTPAARQAIVLLHSLCSSASSVPALFAFGDSLADDGNNNYLATLARANFPPYGNQFDTERPTGRFTNGRNQIDYLAAKLGLPLVPPYLDPSVKGERLLNGVNFASAGSGILDFTNFNAGRLMHITEQVKNFDNVKQELVTLLGSANATRLISDSIFCIFTGNNDWIMTYPLVAGFRSSSFQNVLISKLIAQVRELYYLGARKMIVAGVGAMGCAPSQLSRYNSNGCVEFLNAPVSKYNLALQQSLRDLNGELSDSKIVYSDLFLQMMSIMQNPFAYGIKIVDQACCGLQRIQSCFPGVRVCKDASEFYFWDTYHPSSKTCALLVDMLFYQGPPFNFPMSVQELVMKY